MSEETPTRPARDWGEWTPGKGVERIRTEMPGVMPDLTEEDYAAAEAVIAAAGGSTVPGAEGLIADLAAVERLATWLHENFRPLAGDVLIFDDCLEIARHAVGTLKCDVRDAYARGISEGRRQATEGWEREWGGRWMQDAVEPTDDVYLCSSETDARALEERSGGYRRAESRPVGPWEPAEGGSDA